MFCGKVAVVSGGSNGIGKEICREFEKRGAVVVNLDIAPPKEECEEFVLCDLTVEAEIKSAVAVIKEKFGKVDFLVNNACVTRRGILSGCGFEDFLYVQKLGVVAPYMLTMLLEPCAVVNIASTRAGQSQKDTESYSSAKGGIVALTHALSVSLAGKTRVNCISPGWIDTAGSEFFGADNSQHPTGRVGKPSDIAKMVAYLCGEDAEFISGQNITIDGGMSKLMVYHGDEGWKLGE